MSSDGTITSSNVLPTRSWNSVVDMLRRFSHMKLNLCTIMKDPPMWLGSSNPMIILSCIVTGSEGFMRFSENLQPSTLPPILSGRADLVAVTWLSLLMH
ncbi:hypothetical protein GOP47_0029818 [Adiantum capillus-veneris]|nr:hypothetical protein GOP47_0029818 [Adiantum capillus-veneris]